MTKGDDEAMNVNCATILLGKGCEPSDTPIEGFLAQLPHQVSQRTDGVAVVRKAFGENPDLILLDVSMPRLNGYQCARLLKNDPLLKPTPLILMGSSAQHIHQYWASALVGSFWRALLP